MRPGLERSVNDTLRTVPVKVWFWVEISHLLFLGNPSLAQTPFFPTQLLPSFYTENNSRVTALGCFPLAEEGQGPWSWQNCHPISVPDSP